MEVSQQEREAFFRHMGHSRAVDEAVYQCPLGVTEICTVGRYLHDLDQGVMQGNNVSNAVQLN
jgi:hypothetical protein